MQLNALFRLAFATAPPLGLTSLHRVTRRLIMQKARSQASRRQAAENSPSTACKHTVSGTISLPSPGCFSPFPHGTSSLSVASEYLALEDGPPRFPRDCTCPAVLGNCLQEDRTRFVYGTITLSGWPFQAPSTTRRFDDFPGCTLRQPHNPASIATRGLGSSA